jgi:hypothetical protein
MSSPTNESRNNPGRKRRRRNRGGQNRNPQSQSPQQGAGARPQGQGRQANQGPRPSRRPLPVKLTWWQKLLKAIGLYKEPAKPVRPQRERTERPERVERTERVDGPKKERPSQPVKSNVRVARGAEGYQPKRDTERERGPVESPRLYVGNLSYDVSESDLTDLFKGIGGVRNIEIVYNRNTHRSKGYGFVEMLHVDDAKRAVEVLHDQFFMGRKLNVSGAKSKGQDEREDRDEEREERRPKPQAAAAAAPAEPVVETAEAAPVEPIVASEPSAPTENQTEAA